MGQVLITPDAPLLSGWSAALYFTVRAIDEERGRWLVLAGLATGLAALGKYTGLPPPAADLPGAAPRRARAAGSSSPPGPGSGWRWPRRSSRRCSSGTPTTAGSRCSSSREGRTSAFGLRPVLFGRFVGLQALAASPLLWLGVMAAPFVARGPLARALLAGGRHLRAAAGAAHGAHRPVPLGQDELGRGRLPDGALRRSPPGSWSAGSAPGCAATPGRPARWPASPASTCTSSRWCRPSPSRRATRCRPAGASWRRASTPERRGLGGDPLVVGCTYKPAAELMFHLPGQP